MSAPLCVAIFMDRRFLEIQRWETAVAAKAYAAGIIRGGRYTVRPGHTIPRIRAYVLPLDEDRADMFREQPPEEVTKAMSMIEAYAP